MGAIHQALLAMKNLVGDAPFLSPLNEPTTDFWLKANSLSLSDGDPVALWEDLAAGGKDYGAAGSARPTFKSGILDGKAVVRFATDDVLTPTGSAFTYGENNTMFVVCTKRTSGTGYIFSGDHAALEGGPSFITGYSNGGTPRDFEYFSRGFGERKIFATSASAGFHVLAIRRDDGGSFGETYQLFFDGPQVESNLVIGDDNWNGVHLTRIGRGPTAGDFYNGDIAEIIHCNSLLDNSTLNRMYGYLLNEYPSLSVTLL
jgi:hypothetical protein